MTQETFITIDLKDISALVFHCECGASKHFNPEGNIDVPAQCHQCGANMAIAGTPAYRVIRSFMESLKQVRLLDPSERYIRLAVPVK